ncbi:MAG: hypothetical protein Q8N09_05975 [Thermodesulfovibrionia bacterium]|nr:hypothetical protein [Thermodesulfovibrionia bacterium]
MTKVERILNRIKNHPVISVFIVIGIVIISLSTFKDSLHGLFGRSDGKTQTIQQKMEKSPGSIQAGRDVNIEVHMDKSSSVSRPVARFPFDLQIRNAKERIRYLSQEYLKTDTMSLIEVIGAYGDNVLDSPQLYDWNKVMNELEKQGYIKIILRTENNIEFKVLGRRFTEPALQAPFDMTLFFYPSGWMGDGEYGTRYIQLNTAFKECNRTGDTDGLCIKISYQPNKKGWAGIYWQYPDSNWGDQRGRRIMGDRRIIFWAKGERGGEVVEFKAGGINAPNKPYRDSFEVFRGRIVLTGEWRRYEISLSGQDLSNVIGAFAWVASRDTNPGGVTFYLDDIRYE